MLKQQVFVNVHEILQIYGGVWITSDLDTRDSLNRIHNTSSEFQKLVQTIQSMTGSTVDNGNFASFEHIQQFVKEQGFRIETYDMLDMLKQLTCLQPLKITPDVAESILASSSVSILTIDDT